MVDIALKVGCDRFIYVSSVDSLDKRKGNDVIREQDTYNIDKVEYKYEKKNIKNINFFIVFNNYCFSNSFCYKNFYA